MNYKEALFFIGACLTINHDAQNLERISEQIKSTEIDWDQIVKVSTSHYVFPALYVNLKAAGLLEYLPEELVQYMDHITSLNRDRNLQIVKQARTINSILRSHKIEPIFIKGTGFLLQNFYSDLGERMAADIDLLVNHNEVERAISILKDEGYSEVFPDHYNSPSPKHYPRIQKEGEIAAVEVHFSMTIYKYKREFNFESVLNDCLIINDFKLLSYPDQLAMTLIAKQINDNGYKTNTVSLRNGYDAFKLCHYTDSLESIKRFKFLFDPLNNHLFLCSAVFNSNKFNYDNTQESSSSMKLFLRILDDPEFGDGFLRKVRARNTRKKKLRAIGRSFYQKDYAIWALKKITNPKWYRRKMIELGFISKS